MYMRTQTTFPLLVTLLALFSLGPSLWSTEEIYPVVAVPLPEVTIDSMENRLADQALEELRSRDEFASLAARNLAALGVRDAIPELASIVAEVDPEDDLLLLAAVEALGALGGDQARQALEGARSRVQGPRFQQAVHLALERCGGRRDLIL